MADGAEDGDVIVMPGGESGGGGLGRWAFGTVIRRVVGSHPDAGRLKTWWVLIGGHRNVMPRCSCTMVAHTVGEVFGMMMACEQQLDADWAWVVERLEDLLIE